MGRAGWAVGNPHGRLAPTSRTHCPAVPERNVYLLFGLHLTAPAAQGLFRVLGSGRTRTYCFLRGRSQIRSRALLQLGQGGPPCRVPLHLRKTLPGFSSRPSLLTQGTACAHTYPVGSRQAVFPSCGPSNPPLCPPIPCKPAQVSPPPRSLPGYILMQPNSINRLPFQP